MRVGLGSGVGLGGRFGLAASRFCLELVNLLDNFGEEGRESGFFLGGKAAENEIDVAEFLAEFIVPGAEAKTRKIGSMERFGDGFETVVAAGAALGAVAEAAERQIKIITNDQDVFEGDFVEIGEFGDGAAGIVIESLGFDKDLIAVFEPEGVEFGLLPGEIFDFGIKIKRQEAEVMAGEVVFWAGVAEADDEFHRYIIAFFE